MAIQRFHPQAEVVPPDLAALHQQVADLSAENAALKLELFELQVLVAPPAFPIQFPYRNDDDLPIGPC